MDSNMNLKLGHIRLVLLVFYCGLLFQNYVAAVIPITTNYQENAVVGGVTSRSIRDVGAAIWPMTGQVEYERPARAPESMTEAVVMIDNFWRNFGTSSETASYDNKKDEVKYESSKQESLMNNNDVNENAQAQEITSRLSDDDQKTSADVPVLPPSSKQTEPHLSLYPTPTYIPNHLLTPYGPSNYVPTPSNTYPSSIVPMVPPHYGNGVVPISTTDPEINMEFAGNRPAAVMHPSYYPYLYPPEGPYAPSQFAPIPTPTQQGMYSYLMMKYRSQNSLHPPSSTILYNTGTQGVPHDNSVSHSTPQSTYPLIATNPSGSGMRALPTYPYHQ